VENGKKLTIIILIISKSNSLLMKKELMDILACPVCKGDLNLTIGDEDGEEILTGTLRCVKCDFDYPIEESIPNLLPPKLQEK